MSRTPASASTWPIGVSKVPLGTGARAPCERLIASKKSTGPSSRMAAVIMPLASTGVAGMSTFQPGTCANQAE